MFFKSIATLAIFTVGALARDSLHFVNCGEGANGNPASDSVIVFCNDDSNCHFNPAPSNYCVVSSDGQLTTWERSGDCTFTTGVRVNWSIRTDARNQPDFSTVGSAGNGSQDFSCMKDNSPVMYVDSFGQACKSIYYCFVRHPKLHSIEHSN
ncbi:hypothetical protein CI102_12759 [Trichoderma harzianum]|uniref:Uncharacterized protein n=1 Tax=Trichoderma harzianum CBS 226.95 TaxID=983964 RepID=A0A2T3ZWL5_TRIHA|nr:hypothetical protein M431DRAFT_98114 [Trichoderma harzianum CBS 226.95]PKK43193.1 hypothetical protein CI102_12759 [Trichoderma harzianum]PTB49205.1 hypothetical protein M431DRAFT_98114 [Trichoderma harzianum CBS 226.95]